VYLDGNTISANASGYCTNAINLTDVANTGSTMTIDKYKVRNNSITNVYNGITATNVKHGLIVYQNPTISLRNDGTSVNGIRITNCLNARVYNNPNITISPTVTPVTSTSINYKGIVVTTSNFSLVGCNAIFSMGESMVFVGLSSASSVYNDQMTSGNRGLVLRTNGEIGQQGTSTQPCGLWWNNSFTAQTYADNVTNNNSNSGLNVNSNSAPAAAPIGMPTLNGNVVSSTPYSTISPPTPPGLNAIASTYPPALCNLAIFMPLNTNSQKSYVDPSDLSELATDDNFYPVYEPETQYNSKKIAYESIDDDNSLIAGDSVLQNFYDSTQTAPMGQLRTVDNMLALDDFTSAAIQNDAVSTTNLMETNQKEFNRLYLLPMQDSTYIYSTSDIDAIHNIAIQCPFDGGSAVWQARVLYCTILNQVIEFEDPCDQKAKTTPSYGSGGNTANFWVYPNPTDGDMTLVYNIPGDSKGRMVIYDVAGRVIKTYNLSNKGTSLKINEGNLVPGEYFCSVYINDILDGTQKLTIIK
jgi:hypothetical protein